MRVFRNWRSGVWYPSDLAFSPDGTWLAAPMGDRGVNLWRTDDSAAPTTVPLPLRVAMRLAFAPDSDCLYAGEIELCSLRLSDMQATLLPFAEPYPVHFAGLPGGRLLVAERPQRTEKRLRCITSHGSGEPLWTESGVGGFYSQPLVMRGADRFILVEWVGDSERETRVGRNVELGAQVIVGGLRFVLRCAITGRVLGQSPHLTAEPVACALSPSDEYVAWTTRHFIHVHPPLDSGNPLATIQNDSGRWFTALAFHPSGHYLAATSNDATVKLYDTATWQVAKTYTWDVGRLRSVAFSPDGTRAAVGSDTGKVVVWDVDL